MMDKRSADAKFMRLAINEAGKGIKSGQAPFGACIVRDGCVVALAHNQVWSRADITAHAEINALRKACKKLKSVDLSGCVIYSTCEPCPMCFAACHWAGISRVIFGARISDAAKAGFNELKISCQMMKRLGGSKLKITRSFLRGENLKLFSDWSKRKDKKAY